MNAAAMVRRLVADEDLNFLLTNRIPRIALTRFVGWFSRIESPLLARIAIRLWSMFTDLDLADAESTEFRSVHACFTRRLRSGARTVDADPRIVVSPSDGIVGACGRIAGTTVFQAKGFPYRLEELIPDAALIERVRGGSYATLRLTSAMYHRFHAPHDIDIARVIYISGDTWNVNPIALRRIERLFCKNERAVIDARLSADGTPLLIVPVAAVLVASMRLHCADVLLNLRYDGPNEIPCRAHAAKGVEMGWFEHGSTILVFAPPGIALAPGIADGHRIRMGEPLFVSEAGAA